MKLPRLTSGPSDGAAWAAPRTVTDAPSSRGVQPMADIGCLESCVGPTARSCASCGSDLQCWTKCAGPLGASCIASCFRGG